MSRIPRIAAVTLCAVGLMTCPGTEAEFSAGDASARSADGFQYLEYRANSLVSKHAIRIALAIPAGYRRVAPLNHRAIFNDHPFNVSVAGLIGDVTVPLYLSHG